MEPINVGVMPNGHGPLDAFARRLAQDVHAEVERATQRAWRFHVLPEQRMVQDEAQRPSDFLDQAALRMVEGPYDLIVVITDVPVVARQTVAGVASAVARVVVVSTWRLRVGPRGDPMRPPDAPAVRWNAAALLLHLVGHALGAPAGGVPWRFDPAREHVPRYTRDEALRRGAAAFPEKTCVSTGAWDVVWFHVTCGLRHPRQVLRPLLRSGAPLLPLSLPRLSTAAVVPALVLLFTAEIWDVGIHMGSRTALWLGLLAVLAAAAYITFATQLLFPRKERRLMTEHLAVVNVSIIVTVVVAMLGLLLMLGGLVLALAVWVFPAGLIHTWPTLNAPAVNFADKLRIALFVSSLGTVTGALAAGLESRTVLHHLALFREEV